MFRRERNAWVNLALIGVNVVCFLLFFLAGGTHSTARLIALGGLTAEGVFDEHRYYLLITSMFLHGGLSHLFNNMLVLFFLGDNMERALGRARYFLFYMVCGIGSGLISAGWYRITGQDIVSVGASGAIFGVIGGLLWLVLKNRGRLEDLSTSQLLLLIGFSLYHGLLSAGVDNAAHIGGMVIGFLLAMVLYRRPQARYSETGIFDSYSDSDWH